MFVCEVDAPQSSAADGDDVLCTRVCLCDLDAVVGRRGWDAARVEQPAERRECATSGSRKQACSPLVALHAERATALASAFRLKKTPGDQVAELECGAGEARSDIGRVRRLGRRRRRPAWRRDQRSARWRLWQAREAKVVADIDDDRVAVGHVRRRVPPLRVIESDVIGSGVER